jgi:hypothetical protein
MLDRDDGFHRVSAVTIAEYIKVFVNRIRRCSSTSHVDFLTTSMFASEMIKTLALIDR